MLGERLESGAIVRVSGREGGHPEGVVVGPVLKEDVEIAVVDVADDDRQLLQADLDRHRLTDLIGADHVFDSLHEALAMIREKRLHAVEAGTSGAGWKSVE